MVEGRCATRDQIREDVLITEEEMCHFARSCISLKRAWTKIADRQIKEHALGAAAYAARSATLFDTLATRARKAFADVDGSWDKDKDPEVTGKTPLL